jgi:beta-N-acetylhexosaminidase
MNTTSYTSGVLMLDLEGLSLTAFEKELLQRPSVGGLILFSRNFSSSNQLKDLIAEIRSCNQHLLIAVDQEGGRVQRFREGFLRLPALHTIGLLYNEAPDRASSVARQCGWAMAAEILHHGIDLSFAPVLDRYHVESKVIKERAFAANADVIGSLARCYIEGMHEAGMAATGKHYPGHGSVIADSHVELPTDRRSLEEIMGTDFQAFAACIDVLDAIMPAHVVYPAVDELCAGYSPIWIQDKLRGELGFKGIVFSDDLSMAAAHSAGDATSRAQLALTAGCDMVLVCNDRSSALAVSDWLEAENYPLTARLGRMRAKPASTIENLYSENRWAEATAVVESLTE